MEKEEEQKSASIKEGEVLQVANNILGLLEYSQQLEDEEVLFSDEFYISILSNLLTEQNYEINPGETPEQKVKSLKQLIKLLSEIIEVDLSQISAKGIIMEHDKFSAKSLLELIEELIKTLMNANLEEGEENNEKKEKKKDKKEESIELKQEKNNSEDNFRKIRERMRLDDDDDNEENNEEKESSSYKRKYAELEDGIDNIDYEDEKFKEEDVKIEEKDNKDKLINIDYDLGDDKNNLSGSRVMNVSHISEMEKNKIQGSSAENKEIEENIENKSSSKKSDKKKKPNKNKYNKYNDIPDLLINKIKEDKKINKDENTDNNEEKEYEEESLKFNKYLDSNSNLENSNLYEGDNYYVPQSVPRAYNKLHLSNTSKESESSKNKFIRSKKNSNNKKNELNEKQNSSNTNSNISFHSKKNNVQDNNIDELNDLNISSSNKKKIISSNIKDNENSNLKESKSNKSKIEDINEENEIEEDDISKSSEHSKASKSSKSSYAKKSNRSKQSKQSEKKEKENNNIYFFEIPMSEEELKITIKKELRKLYGEKASRYFSKDFLELISQNLKMARKEILKTETGQDVDDFFSREFFQKYQKQMQQLIKNCVKELNQENQYKKNVIMNIGNNVQFMKKLKDAENKDISDMIENKRKENESRNDENNLSNLQQILMYPSYCFELQKNIYLMQTQNQIQLNLAIEKEREKSIEETKQKYENNISELYDILKKQKRQRLNKKKFGEILDFQLRTMKKNNLRQKLEDMLDLIDEDDNKVDIYDNNKEDIEQYLKNIA